jgi:hypothetical protein
MAVKSPVAVLLRVLAVALAFPVVVGQVILDPAMKPVMTITAIQ